MIDFDTLTKVRESIQFEDETESDKWFSEKGIDQADFWTFMEEGAAELMPKLVNELVESGGEGFADHITTLLGMGFVLGYQVCETTKEGDAPEIND